MATYSFPVPRAWFQYFSGSKLGRHQTRPWTQPNVSKCLLDHADDAPLAINSIECFKWSENSFLSWRSGIQHVAMVTKIVSSYCRAPLVEPYCKKSNISDKNWLRYPCLSYLIKIWLSVWRHHLANLHILKTWISLEQKEIYENSKQHFSCHAGYLFMF